MTVGLGDIGKLWLSTKNPDPQSISNNFYGQRGMPTTNAALNVPVPCLVGQTVTVGHTAQYLPQAMSSTGMITIAFVDANGITMAIAVDQAYVNTMYQISNSHQMKRAGGLGVGSYYPQNGSITITKPEPMLEGDFSYNEMELAETIIEELESGRESRQ